MDSAEAQLASFMARYTPEIVALASAVLAKMRARLPGALELVYDNFNALVIGFGPTERASDAWFSIALYPRWVNLFFLHGVGLPDPDHRLKGEGNQVRSIRLTTPEVLDEPEVRALMEEALLRARVPPDPDQPRRTVIRSISARQRPRRPGGCGDAGMD